MATRHVYDVDDVCSTAAYGLLTGDTILAVRAAKELSVSGESDRLFRLLTFLWLLDTPDHVYETQRSAAFIAHDTTQLLYAMLVSTPRQLPPLPLPITTTSMSASDTIKYIQPPPDDTSPNLVHLEWDIRPPAWTDRQCSQFIKRIRYALRKYDAWNPTDLSSQLLRPARNLEALCSLLHMLGVHTSYIDLLRTIPYDPMLEHILGHAYASLCPVTADVNAKLPQKAVAIYKDISTVGGHKGRTFHIPPDALNMWCMRSRPLVRWNGAPLFVADESVTAYWVHLCKQYKITIADGNLVTTDGSSSAAFFDAAFPDDIPDEWDDTEWLKSHEIQINSAQNVWRPGFMMFL